MGLKGFLLYRHMINMSPLKQFRSNLFMENKSKKAGASGKLIPNNDASDLHVSFSSRLLANKPLVHIALIIFLILIVYSNSLQVPFQMDEEMHIVHEPIIKDLHYFIHPSEARGFEHYNFFKSRYIPYLTFALNYRVNGLSVAGYHIVNIAIHMGCAILVYLLVLLTFRTPFMSDSSLKQKSPFIALLSALLFAAHPLQTAAVTYVMQRFASLVAFFYLLSLTAYIYSRLMANGERQKGKGGYRSLFFYCISFISAVLAMKTKENAFTLPFVVLMYEFCFFNGGIKKRMLFLAPVLLTLCIIPLTLMSMTGAAGKINSSLVDPGSYMAGFTWDYSRGDYFYTQFRVIVTYLRMLFFPTHLVLDYEYPVFRSFIHPQVILSFIFLTALFGLGVYLVIKQVKVKVQTESPFAVSQPQPLPQPAFRLIGFGILWFFITLSVESIITTPRLIETYRSYLPSAGAIISTVVMLFLFEDKVRSPKVRKLILVMVVVIIGGLSVATYLQNRVYEDRIKTFELTAKRFPAHAGVQLMLGIAYAERNMPDKAIEHFQTAIRLNPDYWAAHFNLGGVYKKLNMPDKAIEQYLITIKLNPDYVEAHNNLGLIYQKLNMIDKAIEQYQIAIKLKPDNASAYNNLGAVYQARNLFDKAMEQYLIAIKLKPDYADPHFNLGVIYYNMGQKENAKREIMAGLKIAPDNQQAQQLLNKISALH